MTAPESPVPTNTNFGQENHSSWKPQCSSPPFCKEHLKAADFEGLSDKQVELLIAAEESTYHPDQVEWVQWIAPISKWSVGLFTLTKETGCLIKKTAAWSTPVKKLFLMTLQQCRATSQSVPSIHKCPQRVTMYCLWVYERYLVITCWVRMNQCRHASSSSSFSRTINSSPICKQCNII